jgi:hypothetical protein
MNPEYLKCHGFAHCKMVNFMLFEFHLNDLKLGYDPRSIGIYLKIIYMYTYIYTHIHTHTLDILKTVKEV